MQSIRLIQFSDMHLFGDAAGRLRGVASLPALQAAISDAHRRGSQPDAVLLTGDLVQDDPEAIAGSATCSALERARAVPRRQSRSA